MVTGLFSLVYGFKHMKFEGQNYLNRAEQHTLFGPVLMKIAYLVQLAKVCYQPLQTFDPDSRMATCTRKADSRSS